MAVVTTDNPIYCIQLLQLIDQFYLIETFDSLHLILYAHSSVPKSFLAKKQLLLFTATQKIDLPDLLIVGSPKIKNRQYIEIAFLFNFYSRPTTEYLLVYLKIWWYATDSQL